MKNLNEMTTAELKAEVLGRTTGSSLPRAKALNAELHRRIAAFSPEARAKLSPRAQKVLRDHGHKN